MKIGILTSNPSLKAIKRLYDAAVQRGHEVRILNVAECFVKVSSTDPQVHYRGGENLVGFDAIIPRIGPAFTFFGTAVLRQFEMQEIYPLNNSLSVLRARDKLRSLQILSKHKIPMPTTGFAHSPQDTDDVIQSVGGAPLVIKLVEGTEGVGVVLTETKSAAKSVITAFKSLKANILVQEFIKESSGRDIRCFVIGNKVVAAMERVAQEGEFRANFDLGASVYDIKITAQERALAIQSAKLLGLQVAGVDILRSARGPLVLEINASPGLEGIELATGKDIAGLMIEHIEKNAKPYTQKNTG